MLLTEDEAKTKECRVASPVHMPRQLGDPDWATGRLTPLPCAASGCMHWRWGTPKIEVSSVAPPENEGWGSVPAMGDGVRRWRRIVAKRGSCGLAGPTQAGDGDF